MRRIAGFLVFLAAGGLAGAAEYYASPGDDIQDKVAALQPGDTLNMNEGTYNWNDAWRFGTGYTQIPSSAAGTITIKAAPAASSKPHIHCTTAGQNAVDIYAGMKHYRFEGLEFSGGSSGIKINAASYITFEDCYIHDTASTGVGLKLDTHHITFTGCEVARPGGTGECFYVGNSNDQANHQVNNCLIVGCLIHGTRGTTQGDGVELKYMTYANTIRDNVLYDLKYPAVFVHGHPSRTSEADLNVVEGNAIFDTDDMGVQIYGQVIVRNNVIFDTAGAGIGVRKDVNPVGQVRLINNTIYDCQDDTSVGRAAVELSYMNDCTGVVLANNCVRSTSSWALALNPYNQPPGTGTQFHANLWYSSGKAKPVFINQTVDQYTAAEFRTWLIAGGYAGTDLNNSDANPLFENAAANNFYPQSGSPLIDMGNAAWATSSDFDGVARDSSPDCGAYEWTASGGPLWSVSAAFKGTGVGPEDPPDGDPGGGGGCSTGLAGGRRQGTEAAFWILFVAILLGIRLFYMGAGAADAVAGRSGGR
ncbi:MAG: right-handed parallel beta-helix repeat-containing protein [Planctomycetes bacterium]|nr:right-handed parallel beta-helix repeat-containing protein [Planctomycetota bacterium]